MLDHNRLRRGVPYDHSPLVREIRVHGAGRVRNTEPLLEGCSTPRTDLGFVSIRQPPLDAEEDQRWRRVVGGGSGPVLKSRLSAALLIQSGSDTAGPRPRGRSRAGGRHWAEEIAAVR